MASEKGRSTRTNGDTPTERHEEFRRENGEWSRRVEESLTDLEKLAGETDRSEEADTEKTAPA
jgi:hypothetical protein